MPKLLVAKAGGATETEYWMPMQDGNMGKFQIDHNDLLTELEGEHLCGIIGYSEDFEIQSAQYGPRQMIKLLFRVLDGPEKGGQFALIFGYSLGPKAKLNKVIAEARGEPIAAGEEIDFDSLIGLKLYLFVTTETVTKNNTDYQNIYFSGCRKATKGKGAAQPALVAAQADDRQQFDPFSDE